MELTPTLIWLQVEPKTQTDREKLSIGLEKLRAEDPTIGLRAGSQSGQVIIGAISVLRLEVILDRLKREFNVEASVGKPQVAYKETITQQAGGEGRFVRQTGGRGQYGHAKVRVYPGERGTGYIFQNGMVGSSVPNHYIKSIDDGIEKARASGVLAGYPVDDVKVELYDASYHEVDSSAMAFEIAGAMAFQEAAKKASPVLLEPVMRLEVDVPPEYVADVVARLADRRGQIQSQEARGETRIVQARVPFAEMFGYGLDLHSRTFGRATYSMTFDRYERCPDHRDDDADTSAVREPHHPTPNGRASSIALPEPDEDALDV